MKIDVCESLAYSYLRHVKRCWIVQTNWKASERWDRCQDADLEVRYSEVIRRFDPERSVVKQTKATQFLKQGEIDAVGVDQQGEIHAMEVAFHGAGLNYGSSSDSDNVLKKMLRTLFILRTYQPQTPVHIYFLSPKARRGVRQALEAKFAALREEYADVEWHLLTDDDFAEAIVEPTLANTSGADTSELFVRSVKLLETAGYRLVRPRTGQGGG